MDPSWEKLKNELTDGPFSQKGFSKQLQRQIENKMDKQSKLFRNRSYRLAGAWCIMLLVFSFIGLNWTPITESVVSFEDTAVHLSNQKAIVIQEQVVITEPTPVKSVLLIGLRTDLKSKNEKSIFGELSYSEYRSLMITGAVNDPAKLEVAAEGSGILVPYHQNFWKIEPITIEDKANTYHYLTAYKASEGITKRKQTVDAGVLESMHNEKLVFAGNQYVSIHENDDKWSGNQPGHYEKIWTKTIEQVNNPTNKAENTISLEKIFNNQATQAIAQLQDQVPAPQSMIKDELTGNSWTISRSQGQWIPKVAETIDTTSYATSYILHPLPFSLPESVVSYDKLALTWEQIVQAQPQAIDAASSPDGDMIAIITADKLYAYPLVNNQIGKLALQVDLHDNESMVMAQWATAKYANNWVVEGKRYLK
ncbi:hypothetical protein EHS13_17030 [Paenibacillus psychroresistens]|uniref:Uncharacterized protein n=1 Tax=Paenibacillus psychroresistens TaxID=1778678 RepID=A0A6B8RLR0_9BACL|nr:hypothetical protein [Paenibacillus psychroresistens]QGQ96465.1 hypothetical protein EHS13_17030 [Paenibacillus psychroresistens]